MQTGKELLCFFCRIPDNPKSGLLNWFNRICQLLKITELCPDNGSKLSIIGNQTWTKVVKNYDYFRCFDDCCNNRQNDVSARSTSPRHYLGLACSPSHCAILRKAHNNIEKVTNSFIKYQNIRISKYQNISFTKYMSYKIFSIFQTLNFTSLGSVDRAPTLPLSSKHLVQHQTPHCTAGRGDGTAWGLLH